MLRTERMQKIRLVCLNKDRPDVIVALHRLGIVDLRKSNLELSDDVPAPISGQLSDYLIKVNGALSILHEKPGKKYKHLNTEELLGKLGNMSALDHIYELDNRRKEINEDQKLLDNAAYVARSFLCLDINFGELESKNLAFKAYETDKKVIKNIRREVKSKKISAELMTCKAKKHVSLFVAYKKGENFDDIAKQHKMREFDLYARYLDDTPIHILKNTEQRTKENNKELQEIAKEFEKLSVLHYAELQNIREMLEIEIARANVSASFKKTEKTFVLEGWIPANNFEELDKTVKHICGGRYYLEKIAADELAPTLVRRPRFLKPFDFLMEFMAVPRSDEIDPTWIFIVSFPIFYGLMISDVGYGVLSFLFAWWVTTKTDPNGLTYNTAKIWQLSAISAIVFGILSNQYFGVSLDYHGLWSFNWLSSIPQLLLVTIIFGLLQVALGMFLGFVNNWNHGHKKMAVSKLTSIILMLTGIIAVAGALFNMFEPGFTLAMVAISIVMYAATVYFGSEVEISLKTPIALLMGGLTVGVIEVISNLLTHSLSYLRIMGFGLASIILAALIDKEFLPSFSHGILIFILYAVIFIVLHFMNMIVSIFEGAVQAARLNFVEFFSKFYTGGGVKYKPFAYKRNYTKE